MRTVLRLVAGLLKLSFLAVVFMWTMIMNFIGQIICVLTVQN